MFSHSIPRQMKVAFRQGVARREHIQLRSFVRRVPRTLFLDAASPAHGNERKLPELKERSQSSAAIQLEICPDSCFNCTPGGIGSSSDRLVTYWSPDESKCFSRWAGMNTSKMNLRRSARLTSDQVSTGVFYFFGQVDSGCLINRRGSRGLAGDTEPIWDVAFPSPSGNDYALSPNKCLTLWVQVLGASFSSATAAMSWTRTFSRGGESHAIVY
jgi:hypothetical protein